MFCWPARRQRSTIEVRPDPDGRLWVGGPVAPVASGRSTLTRKARNVRVRQGAVHGRRPRPGLGQYFGPANSSSRATASRRATEIVFRLEKRQETPS